MMSSPSVLAFYGLRFRIEDEDEIEQLEERSHSLFKQARESGLQCYWGNFAALNDNYYCYLGHKIGVLGEENESELELDAVEFLAIAEQTESKLKSLGHQESPKLYLHWEPDA